jgi:hypothetical protein
MLDGELELGVDGPPSEGCAESPSRRSLDAGSFGGSMVRDVVSVVQVTLRASVFTTATVQLCW